MIIKEALVFLLRKYGISSKVQKILNEIKKKN